MAHLLRRQQHGLGLGARPGLSRWRLPGGSLFCDLAGRGQFRAAPLHAYSSGRDLLGLKLSSNGDYQWHTFYGGSGSDQATGIALSPTGDLYLSGYSSLTWQGSAALLPDAFNAGIDISLLKLSGGGDYLCSTFYGGTDEDVGFAVALDGQSPLVLGSSKASWLGAGGAAPLHPYTADADLALLAFDQDGSYAWHTFYGSALEDRGSSLAWGAARRRVFGGLLPGCLAG